MIGRLGRGSLGWLWRGGEGILEVAFGKGEGKGRARASGYTARRFVGGLGFWLRDGLQAI